MTPKIKRSVGRPRKTDGRNFYEGELHSLLVKNLPSQYVKGERVKIAELAEAIGVSKITIYHWFLNDRITVEGAKAILTLDTGEEQISKVMFIPFLFG